MPPPRFSVGTPKSPKPRLSPLSARRARIAQLVTAKSAAAKRRVAAAAQEETDGDFAMSFLRKRE
jgi:hypothetical protein